MISKIQGGNMENEQKEDVNDVTLNVSKLKELTPEEYEDLKNEFSELAA